MVQEVESTTSDHDCLLLESASKCEVSISLDSNDTDDVNELMLRAIKPPDHTDLTFPGIIRQIKLNARRKRAFKMLIKRGNMNVWTLHFHPAFETAFRAYSASHAARRIRAVMALGAVAVTLKGISTLVSLQPIVAHSPSHQQIILALYIGTALPATLVALACTYVRRLDRLYEWYSSIPFVLVTAALTTEKLVEGSRGPVFALFIVIVAVFGVSRLRFTTSVGVVLVMLFGHLACLWALQSAESWTDVLFQGYNYLGAIVVAGICHYREEVLRRRNFVLTLPFCHEAFDAVQVHRDLHDPRTRKQVLMDRWTLKFKHPLVESAFYNSWYLIDSYPFEHPNCGKLHFRVYRAVRFAVVAAISSQLSLAIQDWEYLHPRSTASGFAHGTDVYTVATTLRFGLMIPACLAIPLSLLIYGRRFYRRWRAHAASVTRGGVVSPAYGRERWSFADTSSSSPATRFRPLATPISSNGGEDALLDEDEALAATTLMDIAYVRMVQGISTGILFVCATCAGIILVLADNRASENNASAAPCYFLGFLNAILFLHRSSFRVRFAYATAGSVSATMITLAVAFSQYNAGFGTYAGYATATNLLAMMVSHEEETLRRVFFMRMTLRSDEFRLRHEAISTIEPVLKQFIRRWRRNRSATETTSPCVKEPTSKIPTVKQICQTGKAMAIAEAGRASFAFIVELAK